MNAHNPADPHVSPDPAPFAFAEFQQLVPEATPALRALSRAANAGLDHGTVELVKVRVSQINGCAFCTALHLEAARKLGVAPAKLDLVAVWREAGLFDAREKAILAFAEALTAMGRAPLPEDALAGIAAHLSRAEIAHLAAAIATINAWNRIAGGLRFPVTTAP
ncbi:carboxymuconolactone decarboxylase family protein [Ancylobacter mangrovi]|uniref:carboxymuconolactone decarboxylase family protein n=1 Tax=Ancylobacter mangrovi TaxID=2972472 RepID=UPI0021626F30|nr:carboxymuconolactone decarboxylase family protein [Ancylobacter mangrovi]MCS0500926.1 carboxymuconolactone decarboxylase family protein [Ancylobacter mangrovi]